jgi:hypothetical protein
MMLCAHRRQPAYSHPQRLTTTHAPTHNHRGLVSVRVYDSVSNVLIDTLHNCQGFEETYNSLSAGGGPVKMVKFNGDGDNKEFVQTKMEMQVSCPPPSPPAACDASAAEKANRRRGSTRRFGIGMML